MKLKTKAKKVEAERLLKLSDEEFRAIGVSRQKISYIKALASTILNKDIDLESLDNKSAQQVREELIRIRE